MRVNLPRRVSRTVVSTVWIFVFLLAQAAGAQEAAVERTFLHPKKDVEKAVQNLHSSSSGHLPLLDGFVENVNQPLERFERAYYQCTFQLTSRATGDTIVRVSAKITAWYADPSPAQSGYRVLPSNGRLENDLLDRLAEALDGKPSATFSGGAASVPIPRPSYKLDLPAPGGRVYSSGSTTPVPVATPPSAEPRTAAASPSGEEEVGALRKQREAAEKRMQQLTTAVRNLEEIQHSQAHPNNLAAVKQAGTPVLAKPQDGARALFATDAQDEFEILELQGEWVHVRISGASRGWIRRAQMEMPEGFAASASKVSAPAAQEVLPFRVAREERGAFPGKWEPLQGKSVKIIWLQPTPRTEKDATPRARRGFAKPLFLKAAAETPPAEQAVAGVVIIFDSADGGEAAATLPTLQQWEAGNLSDEAFWQQCFLDPPEAFRDAKPQ